MRAKRALLGTPHETTRAAYAAPVVEGAQLGERTFCLRCGYFFFEDCALELESFNVIHYCRLRDLLRADCFLPFKQHTYTYQSYYL